MTDPKPQRGVDPNRLATLTDDEVRAITHAALFWYAGEGAMDAPAYEALHTALTKLFPATA